MPYPADPKSLVELFGQPDFGPVRIGVPPEAPAFIMELSGFRGQNGLPVLVVSSDRPRALGWMRPRAATVVFSWLEALLGDAGLDTPVFERLIDPETLFETWTHYRFDRAAKGRVHAIELETAEVTANGPAGLTEHPDIAPMIAAAHERDLEAKRPLHDLEMRIEGATGAEKAEMSSQLDAVVTEVNVKSAKMWKDVMHSSYVTWVGIRNALDERKSVAAAGVYAFGESTLAAVRQCIKPERDLQSLRSNGNYL